MQIFLINSSLGSPIDVKPSKTLLADGVSEGRTFGTWTDFAKLPGRFLSNLVHQIAYMADPSFPFYTPGTVGYFQYPVNFGNQPLVAGSNFGYEQVYQILTSTVAPATSETPIITSSPATPPKM